MAYCTQAEIEAAAGGATALNRIADPTNAASQTAATVALIAAAIKDADALIDTFATGTPGATGSERALWGATIPNAVNRAAVAISLYRVYLRAEISDIPAWVVQDYVDYAGKDGKGGILRELRDGGGAWVVTETPAKQNTGAPRHVSSYDEPRSSSTRRAKRYHTDLL